MRLLQTVLTLLAALVQSCFMQAQTGKAGGMFRQADTTIVLPARPVRAAVEIAGLNAGVWAFGRYVQNADYSRISIASMKRNIRNSFVWDNDQFSTNLLAHPYHGGLYFNAARSNGMSFQTSALFAVGGSLMWEHLMENELPSINDFIATPIGGVCLGEITFRMSNMLLDDRSTGWPRLGREFLAALINPMQGLNRIISGDAWKRRSIRGQHVKNSPLQLYAVGGHRMLAKNRNIKLDNGMFIDVVMYYGRIFSEDSEQPYDAFSIHTTFNLLSRQPLVSNVSVVSRLWGTNIPLRNERLNLHWGVFQHFDYHDSNLMFEQSQASSYRISEAAAFGTGAQLGIDMKARTTFVVSAHLNAILLGGSITDYYRVGSRDYNIGSGFSSKVDLGIIFKTKAAVDFHAETYHLYTWKGYDPSINLASLTREEQASLNVQGDRGKTSFTVLRVNFSCHLYKNINLSTGASCYLRDSHYRFFPSVQNSIVESRIGVGYLF